MSQKRFNRVSAEVIAVVNDANMIYSFSVQLERPTF